MSVVARNVWVLKIRKIMNIEKLEEANQLEREVRNARLVADKIEITRECGLKVSIFVEEDFVGYLSEAEIDLVVCRMKAFGCVN